MLARAPGEIKWWHYEFARVLDVVDGDTIDVEVDVGFHLKNTVRVRLYGVNSPEVHDSDSQKREAAEQAKKWMWDMAMGNECRIATHKTDSFGRYLALVYLWDGGQWVCLNQQLVASGHAELYGHDVRFEPWP
jgi:micrococcal nuclease